MSKKFSSIQEVSSDPQVLKVLKECERLKSTLRNLEHCVSEVQSNFKVLTAERDKIVILYEQAQEEIFQLRQEVIRCTRTPGSPVTAQAMLRCVEIERDAALSDLRRMAAEHGSLREQLKISQETAFNEKAHLEQTIEELETTIQKLDGERLEQVSRVALMKDTIDSLEAEKKRLARRALDSEAERSHREAECVSLRLLNEKTEQSLSKAQQSLAKKKYEMQLVQEKIMLLDEKVGNISRQSLVQQEEISALKETVAQLNKEKATLQGCVEEGREKIAALEGSLAIKEKIISDCKVLISELKHSTIKYTEALCVFEKDTNSLHQQLQETKKELAQTNKNRKSLAQENDRLQEHLSKVKEEYQVLYKKLAKYQHELDNMKLKAQDSNTDIVKLKGVLKSKERENCVLLENYHKACEQGESWEAKYHQAEADSSSLRLALISVESKNHRLKEKMESLEREVEQLQSKCESSHSEIELLRKQLGNERMSVKNLESLLVSHREKENQAQIAKQVKDSEIQFLQEQLSLAENKLAVQSQDLTQLRERAAQLEAELGITKGQLETERFERDCAAQELQRQIRAVSSHLCSTLRSSPEHSHHRCPEWSLECSLEE